MLNIKDKKECCGCTACVNICPQKCIEMVEDREGFLYPTVHQSMCVKCGLCEKVCPLQNKKPESAFEQRAFIVQHKDEVVLKESTAGGAFSAIARYLLKKGGIVFGVAMESDYSVHHICIKDEKDLYKFRNSKYVQSNPEKTFSEVKEYLNDGKLVCYSGTPCQIEGLKNFLKKDYEHLILVDVVCRAVPSPGIWKKYIDNFVIKNGKQKSIRFRDKTLGYQYSTMEMIGEDGRVHRGGIESQQWLRMFFSGMIIRPSCTNCQFREPNRRSDFTIWDCFVIHDIEKSFNEDCGTTRLLIQSPKGERIFSSIKDEIGYKEIDVDIAIKDVVEMRQSPQFNVKREAFYDDCQKLEFQDVLDKYFPIGIKQRLKRFVRVCLNKIGSDKSLKRMIRKIKR